MSLDRDWFGIVRYPGKPEGLHVVLIARFTPGCSQLAGYPKMSTSSGPKDYLKNQIYEALEISKAHELLLVRGRGSTFALLRFGTRYFDIGGEPVEVARGYASGTDGRMEHSGG